MPNKALRQIDYARHSGLSRSRVSELVKAGMPLTSIEAADRWRGMSARQRTTPSTDKCTTSASPSCPIVEASTSDAKGLDEEGFRGAYARQKAVEKAAFQLAHQSVQNRQPDAGRLVAVHATASKNLIELERGYLDLEERHRHLVSGDWVRKIMLEHDGAVAALIKAMPRQLAGRISPHDPEHAERELDRWVQEVCLKTLHETSPWG